MTKIDTQQEWLDKQYKEYVFNKIDNLIEERQSKLDETYVKSRKTVLQEIINTFKDNPSYKRIYEDIVSMLNGESKQLQLPFSRGPYNKNQGKLPLLKEKGMVAKAKTFKQRNQINTQEAINDVKKKEKLRNQATQHPHDTNRKILPNNLQQTYESNY